MRNHDAARLHPAIVLAAVRSSRLFSAKEELEKRASADAAALLGGIKGIGPWTASVILLRGLGRVDVFPMNDTSVTHSLALVSDAEPIDAGGAIQALSPQRGMLYHHLLLARPEASDNVGRASDLPTGLGQQSQSMDAPRDASAAVSQSPMSA